LIHRSKTQQRKRYFDESKETLPDEEDGRRQLKKPRRKSSDGFLPLEGERTYSLFYIENATL
jgi:hypothetical protein